MSNIREIRNSKYWIAIFFIILPAVFVTIWFSHGKMFAGAEEGMPFYNVARTSHLSSYVWQENEAGALNSIILPQYPTMLFMKFLSQFISPLMSQIVFFIFLISSALVGMYLLTKRFINSDLASFISALFYLLNLYTQSQVWNRALFGLMFAWAFLPLFLYLFIKYVDSNKKKWLVLFLISQVIYSYSYMMPTNIFVFLIPSLAYVIFKIVQNRKMKEIATGYLIRAIIVGILWIVVNFWWFYPFIKLSGNAYSIGPVLSKNFESLEGSSKSFPISQIVQLRQKFFFNTESNKETPWGEFYDSNLSYVFSFITLAVALVGLIVTRIKKDHLFILLILLFSLFIVKGTNIPFGYSFYKWLFDTVPFMQSFRNPYEKFGLVFLSIYSVFFGSGLGFLITMGNKVASKIFLLVFSFGVFYYLVWPMWDGSVFQNFYWIQVPGYYSQANDYLNSDTSDSRFIVFPLLPSHGVRFNWGYRGDEPSRFLFDKPGISRYPLKGYDEIYKTLDINLQSNEAGFYKLLNDSNIRYLVLNNDIDWQAVGSRSPENIREYFSKSHKLRLAKVFENLEIYEYEDYIPFSLFTVEDGDAYITYLKESPTHYKVFVKNATNPFRLIFKSSHNILWEARVKGEKVNEHFLVYDYANGWKISKMGNYEIDIVLKVWPWD